MPPKLFEVLVSVESDSALCSSAQSQTLRSVKSILDCQNFYFRTLRSLIQCGVWLRTVKVSAKSDSMQCLSAQSSTPRSVNQRGVRFRFSKIQCSFTFYRNTSFVPSFRQAFMVDQQPIFYLSFDQKIIYIIQYICKKYFLFSWKNLFHLELIRLEGACRPFWLYMYPVIYYLCTWKMQVWISPPPPGKLECGGRVAFRSTAVQNGPWFDAIPLALAFLKMSNVINFVLFDLTWSVMYICTYTDEWWRYCLALCEDIFDHFPLFD